MQEPTDTSTDTRIHYGFGCLLLIIGGMSADSPNWILANKEWIFGSLCTIAAGVFAVLKWWVAGKRIDAPQNAATLKVGAGASINAPMIAGSNNVQHVTIHAAPSIHIPIQQRKPSSPTANEIRQLEAKIPPYQTKQFLQNYIGLNVHWLVRFISIRELNDLSDGKTRWLVTLQYGKEDWGAWIDFVTDDLEKYPIIKIAERGRWAWVEGTIVRVGNEITLDVSRFEFE